MNKKFIRIIALILVFSFILQQIGFAQITTELNIAGHLSALRNSFVVDKFRPLHLRYLQYLPQDNSFKLLLDKGDAFKKGDGSIFLAPDSGKIEPSPFFSDQTKTLLNYFFIGLSLPNDSFWVNLRPDAEDNIIDDYLAKTDIGKIMLETDLQLKKDTASFTSPQTPEGREYWDRLYKKATDLYGYDNVTIPTLTRPWIVPGEIIVRESKDSAYIYKATLKVMLEEDYLKTPSARHPEPRQRRGEGSRSLDSSPSASPQGQNDYSFKDSRSKTLNEYSTQLIKELIIPKLTKEVNSSKRYAPLRQVYYSLILAQWFKARYKDRKQKTENRKQKNTVIASEPQASEAISSRIDSRNLTNLISKEAWSKTTYFQAYQKSFKDGEYNIQESVYTPTGQVIRSYFSGGENFESITGPQMIIVPASAPVSPAMKNLIEAPAVSSPLEDNPAAGSPEKQNVSEEERSYYSTVIDWVEYILRSYRTRFGGNKLIFIGGTSKRAWEAARFLSASYGIEQRNIIYLDLPREVMRRTSSETITKYLEQEGVFDNGNQIAVFDNWTDTRGTLDRVASILKKRNPDIKMIAYLMNDNGDVIDNYARDVPDSRKEVNSADMFLRRTNWMRTDARRQILIAYKEDKEGINPVYLSLPDLRFFLSEVNPDTNILHIAPETLTRRSRDILPLVQFWFESRGFSKYFTYLNEEVRRTYQELVSFCEANPSNVADSQDAVFNELLQERLKNQDSSNKQSMGISRGIAGPTSSPLIPVRGVGGIDFRSLPIVTQAMSNLRLSASSAISLSQLNSLNLNQEWQEIERMASSGITPSSERIKEYLQASCAKGDILQDKDKVILCIADILRGEEESSSATDPTLRDILIVLEASSSSAELSRIFLG